MKILLKGQLFIIGPNLLSVAKQNFAKDPGIEIATGC
jgi:hypothetical protein